MHADALLQAIEGHGTPGHVRHVRLQLQGIKGRALSPAIEQQRQDARARAEIRHTGPGVHLGKIGQEHRVHAEAEAVSPLQDAHARQLQVVQPLLRAYHDVCHGLSSCHKASATVGT